MEFTQPQWLFLLFAIPILGAWEFFRIRKRYSGMRFSTIASVKAMPSSIWVRIRWLPVVLRMGAITLAILALARPQDRNTVYERFAEGVDIMLVLDTSTSMRAQDFEPNRFEAAREVGSEFIEGRTSDRVGLIVFAAKAYTQAPLTLDYGFFAGNVIRSGGWGN